MNGNISQTDPAEGSRKVIERELERMDRKKQKVKPKQDQATRHLPVRTELASPARKAAQSGKGAIAQLFPGIHCVAHDPSSFSDQALLSGSEGVSALYGRAAQENAKCSSAAAKPR